MPRKLTSEEIEAQKDFMYERTVKLGACCSFVAY